MLPPNLIFGETMRSTSSISIFASITLLILASCSEPLVMIPGGKLSGEVIPAPLNWSAVPETIQVEMQPDKPYSINIWSIGSAEDLYIATSERGTRWSEILENGNTDVRVRFGSAIYELKALKVTDTEERERVNQAYIVKYDLDKEGDWVEMGRIFRLDRR